ncbi:MAG: hypothetical protein SFZ24_01985 [Planctomycetota bacterium]|nr:hypothetical protein [Planctomycetota bacterium]
MRSIWIIISTLAIANLLGIAGFLGWLQTSGRLNRDRVERIRTILAPTVATEQAEEQRRQAEAETARQAAEAAAKVGVKPLTAEQRLEDAAGQEEVDAQRSRRVQRETTDLINTLMREREQLDRERAKFDADVAAFKEMRARIAEQEGSEQFQKTVQLYQSVKPADAKNMMASLIQTGKKDQVVSYLNALAPRNASKILAEFQVDDPALAADLLERLRLLGTALAPESPGAAQEPVAAAKPEG